jgi:hypothetical protein
MRNEGLVEKGSKSLVAGSLLSHSLADVLTCRIAW